MKRISTSALALAAAAFFSAGAGATDLDERANLYEPAPQGTSVNWTGFYVGGRVGVGNANHDLSLERYDDDPDGDTYDGLVVFGDGVIGSNPAIQTYDVLGLNGANSFGLIGGGQVGADKQMGRFVAGIFGTYDFSDMETEFTAFDDTSVIASKDYEWSAGARFGYLVNPSTLAYALAAYTETKYDLGDDDSQKFSGVTVGGGIEFAATNNVFFGLEATHTFYDEETLIDEEFFFDRIRLTDDLDETKILATIKLKLNGGLGN